MESAIEQLGELMQDVIDSETKPIDPPDPGLHAGIPAGEYHRWRGASQTRLKLMRDRSPAHVLYEMEHPKEPTPALLLGAAIHDAVLLPGVFRNGYLRDVEGNGQTKPVREKRQRLREEHPHATILRPKDYDTCMAVREAVAGHPIARTLLDGEAERSAVWKDPETGLLCKARFDLVPEGIGALTDLKTTLDASEESFVRAIWNLGYHWQAAHYLMGARELGLDIRWFTIVAAEKEPPYAVAVYHLREDAIQAAADELRPFLELYAGCESCGVWPGYPTEAVEVSLPTWAWSQLDRRIEHGKARAEKGI